MKYNIIKGFSLVFIALFVLFSSTTVDANAGPPASIRLTVMHDGIDFDFDFLIPIEGTLSNVAINQARNKIEASEGSMQYDFYYQDTFPEALITFQDDEGFISNALYGQSQYFFRDHYPSRNEDVFSLYFTTPLRFKAAIIIDGEVFTSPVIEMTQFDFRLTWDIRGVDFQEAPQEVGELSGFVPHPLSQLSTYAHFLIRLVFTLVVELAVLYLFGFRQRKTFLQVGVLNTITQTLLNLGTLNLFFLSHESTFGVLILFILGEFVVFFVETIYLALFVKEKGLMRRVSFALFANLVTLIGGLFLMIWLFETIH